MVKNNLKKHAVLAGENARMEREDLADVFLLEGFRLDRRGGVLYQVDRIRRPSAAS
jgi:hypothetical protein